MSHRMGKVNAPPPTDGPAQKPRADGPSSTELVELIFSDMEASLEVWLEDDSGQIIRSSFT